MRSSSLARAALLLAAGLSPGCGAVTLRLAAAPTVDTLGRPGFEATLAVGTGLPLDLHHRSQHFLQGQVALGGGVDGGGRPIFLTRADLAYLYWNGERIDLRAGAGVAYRGTPNEGNETLGVGGHLGLLPVVWQRPGQIAVTQLCVGPELRAEALIRTDGASPGVARGLVSLPLVIEANLLITGD